MNDHLHTELPQEVEAKTRRKLRARNQSGHSFWQGVGMFGLVGWSVSVPTLLGTGLGWWIDKYHPGEHSWTLPLLIAGLLLGCFNAWYWVQKEEKSIRSEIENDE